MKVNSFKVTCALTIVWVAGASGQSTFIFQNYDPYAGIDAPVFDANGVRLSGTNYAAELWGGVASDSLSPTLDFISGQRLMLPFEPGLAAGYFFSTASMTVWAAPGNGFAWVQVRAWDARVGATYEDVLARGLGGYGESSLLYIEGGNPLGMPPTVPRPLTGLESFSLRPVIPEPSTWTLLALGGATLYWLSRRKR